MSASQGKWGVDRSDDDDWDIISSVGYTALLVAGWRALHATSAQPRVNVIFDYRDLVTSGNLQ